ncbi:YrbL family protein [Achromobacter sp. DMS1]|uniref:YrbL family protein n=1 Tax=Achromobacter sp. DMS1 TaxID=1688405 RepID=UPI002101D2F5|nr:YrbL family protein [Achromobacter sp. DMS1]
MAAGSERDVYEHPRNPALLIKVINHARPASRGVARHGTNSSSASRPTAFSSPNCRNTWRPARTAACRRAMRCCRASAAW